MFRCTIRSLLWLTVVVALVVAWWMDRNRLAQRIDDLERPIYLVDDKTALDAFITLLNQPAESPNLLAPAKKLPGEIGSKTDDG